MKLNNEIKIKIYVHIFITDYVLLNMLNSKFTKVLWGMWNDERINKFYKF